MEVEIHKKMPLVKFRKLLKIGRNFDIEKFCFWENPKKNKKFWDIDFVVSIPKAWRVYALGAWKILKWRHQICGGNDQKKILVSVLPSTIHIKLDNNRCGNFGDHMYIEYRQTTDKQERQENIKVAIRRTILP